MGNIDAELVGLIGGFLRVVSCIATIGLYLQAVTNNIRETNGLILCVLAIVCGFIGLKMSPLSSAAIGIFLLIVGMLSGLTVLGKAIANLAHDANGGVLLFLFGVCLGIGYALLTKGFPIQ